MDWLTTKRKNCLGIDFGSSSIKVAELFFDKSRIVLKNYAIAQVKDGSDLDITRLEADQLAFLLQALFDQAGIKSKEAVISLSVANTFSTIINLPPMPENELAKAIQFEARKYVPVPIEEVELDWSVVGEFNQPESRLPEKPMAGFGVGVENKTNNFAPQAAGVPQEKPKEITGQENQKPVDMHAQPGSFSKVMQVLVVAVPQELIKKISRIAKDLNLKVLALEQEAFSIVRVLVGNDQGTYLIADLGKENIDLIIIDKGSIRLTYSMKKVSASEVGPEISKVVGLYQSRYNRKIARVILTGGRAFMPEWRNIFRSTLGVEVGVGDPLSKLVLDEKVKKISVEIAPFMAVAIGGAMREI